MQNDFVRHSEIKQNATVFLLVGFIFTTIVVKIIISAIILFNSLILSFNFLSMTLSGISHLVCRYTFEIKFI